MTSVGRALESEGEVFGWETHDFTRSEEIVISEYLLVFLLLLVITLMLQYHVSRVWHLHYLPEAGATMLLGNNKYSVISCFSLFLLYFAYYLYCYE